MPARVDVAGDALDQRAQLGERAFEVASASDSAAACATSATWGWAPADRGVDEPSRALDLAALAQMGDQGDPHRHRRAVGVERALEELARAIDEVGSEAHNSAARNRRCARIAPSTAQRGPALEAIDGAIAGVDRFVQGHQRLQGVDGVVLVVEHRLPALDRLVRITEIARIDAGELAPQGGRSLGSTASMWRVHSSANAAKRPSAR